MKFKLHAANAKGLVTSPQQILQLNNTCLQGEI